jgi:hypothetical protein
MRNNFESLLVRSIRNYFATNDIDAFVERRIQSRYRKQYCDIIIDGALGFYAVECKSIGGNHLYFNSNFHTVEDGLNQTHQIETIDWFLRKTARRGFLAVELRNYGRRGNRCHLIPWESVLRRFRASEKGFTADEIKAYPCAVKVNKLYDMTEVIQSFVYPLHKL